MAMASKSNALLYLIYEDLAKAVGVLDVQIFTDRPKSVPKELMKFIAVDIPTEIRGMLKGSVDAMSNCYGSYSIYCKAKTDRTKNIFAQSQLVQDVLDLFPINGTHVTASSPRILVQGEDGYGYQVTQIAFRLRTKLNARLVQDPEGI